MKSGVTSTNSMLLFTIQNQLEWWVKNCKSLSSCWNWKPKLNQNLFHKGLDSNNLIVLIGESSSSKWCGICGICGLDSNNLIVWIVCWLYYLNFDHWFKSRNAYAWCRQMHVGYVCSKQVISDCWSTCKTNNLMQNQVISELNQVICELSSKLIYVAIVYLPLSFLRKLASVYFNLITFFLEASTWLLTSLKKTKKKLDCLLTNKKEWECIYERETLAFLLLLDEINASLHF